jgi:hypothetical protein
MGGKRTGPSNSRCGSRDHLSLQSKRLGPIVTIRSHPSRPESVICSDEAPPQRLTYVDVITGIGARDSTSGREGFLRTTRRFVSRFGRQAPVKTPGDIQQAKIEIGNHQMLARENSCPEKQTAISLKAALITAVIVVFGILHVVGAVMLRDAAAPRPIDTSEVMTNCD